MPNRLYLIDELFPVQTFFNSVSDDSFLRVLEKLTNKIGYSINESDCIFPTDLNPGEKPFDGVRFTIFEQEVVISERDFLSILESVCIDHQKRFPDQEETISKSLLKFKKSI